MAERKCLDQRDQNSSTQCESDATGRLLKRLLPCVMSAFAYIHMVLVRWLFLVIRDKLIPTVELRLDRTGLWRVRKPELNQERMMKQELFVLVQRPFATGRSQFGFDSK